MSQFHVTGCILGTAVGDALGLPYEGILRTRSPRLLGPPDQHRFVFGRGMVSDDTEHTCMVAQALIVSGGDVDRFTGEFARRLRWWLIALPAGIGKATLLASMRLWIGIRPTASGVFSAGNGPAMRAAVFGVCFDDVEKIVRYVRASSRITHTDPKAEFGAIAVALAARMARRGPVDPKAYVEDVSKTIGEEGDELLAMLRLAASSVSEGRSTVDFAEELGLAWGVTGYTYHTVPVVIHAWLSHPQDFRGAVTSVIQCGGDADTTAAIVGGIIGSAVGEQGIPDTWIASLCDWPCTVSWMRRLAEQLSRTLAHESPQRPIRLNPAAVPIRNLVFLVVVIFHGLRRLLPPY